MRWRWVCYVSGKVGSYFILDNFECFWYILVNKCCCIIVGINFEGVSIMNILDNVLFVVIFCKKLDYEDYVNYFIVMLGDFLGKKNLCLFLILL